jgi:hypothetical protein
MPIKDYEVLWKVVPRSDGTYIRFNCTKDGLVIQKEIKYLEDVKDEKAILAFISDMVDHQETTMALLEEERNAPVIAEPATKEQVEKYLISEGILKEQETLDTLKTTLAAK